MPCTPGTYQSAWRLPLHAARIAGHAGASGAGEGGCGGRKRRPRPKEMTPRAKPEPRVGIFWVFAGKLILDSTPVSQAEPWGEAKNHPRSHIEHWAVLQRAGDASKDVEYNDPPRGRVVYFPRD